MRHPPRSVSTRLSRRQTESVKYQDMLYTWSQHIRYTPGGGGVCFFLFLERFFRRGRGGGAPRPWSSAPSVGGRGAACARIGKGRSPRCSGTDTPAPPPPPPPPKPSH